MGKLHTLRRAILREPGRWRTAGGFTFGAMFYDGMWHPVWTRSYLNFVRSILRGVGTSNVGQSGSASLAGSVDPKL